MTDSPRNMTKDQIAKEWALEPLSASDHPTLKFDLVVGDQRIKGREVPFSTFVVGDLTDRSKDVGEYLTRLLGVTVKIETGDE